MFELGWWENWWKLDMANFEILNLIEQSWTVIHECPNCEGNDRWPWVVYILQVSAKWSWTIYCHQNNVGPRVLKCWLAAMPPYVVTSYSHASVQGTATHIHLPFSRMRHCLRITGYRSAVFTSVVIQCHTCWWFHDVPCKHEVSSTSLDWHTQGPHDGHDGQENNSSCYV